MSAEDLTKPLEAYLASIHQERAGLVKKVRHSEQLGLTQARLSGWRAALGDVVAILDAHIEVEVQWWVKIPAGVATWVRDTPIHSDYFLSYSTPGQSLYWLASKSSGP